MNKRKKNTKYNKNIKKNYPMKFKMNIIKNKKIMYNIKINMLHMIVLRSLLLPYLIIVMIKPEAHNKDLNNLFLMLANLKMNNYLSSDHMNFQIELYILDNGKMDIDMVLEHNIGMMAQFIKVIGEIIWQMERVD